MLLDGFASQRARNGAVWNKVGRGDIGEVKTAIPDVYGDSSR